MARTPRERKVRGSKIRSSRDEKQSTEGDERQVTRSSEPLRAEFGHDGEFVETDAVRALKGRIERWLTADRPVHLVGPTGAGKTAMAMQVARERGRPVVFINGDAELTTADLVGEFAEEERESVRDKYIHNVMKSKDIIRDRWVDNPLTVAVREGATLVYNEFSRAEPAANNVLLSVFEEGVLELPGQRGTDRYVEVHPEFRTILTSNSVEYAGVHTPQDALLDRLVAVHMDFYDEETERAIVASRTPDGAPEDAVDLAVTTMRALRERLDTTVGTRAMVMCVEGLAAAGTTAPDTLREVSIDVLASKVATRKELAELRATVEAVIAGEAA
jgi:gas vesicle protein GvpN